MPRPKGRTATRRFTGALATPIKLNTSTLGPQGIFETDAEYAERQSRERRERSQALVYIIEQTFLKLDLLSTHYDIDEADPETRRMLLLLAVCRDKFKGFRIERTPQRPGRKRVWDAGHYSELVADVEKVKMRRGCSELDACRMLVRKANKGSPQGRYKSRTGTSESVDATARALQTRLSEARREKFNPLAPVFDKARSLIGSDEFNEILIDCFATEMCN